MTLVSELRARAHHRIGPGQVWLIELSADMTGGRAGDHRYIDKGTRSIRSFTSQYAAALLDRDHPPSASGLKALYRSMPSMVLAVQHDGGVCVYELSGVPAR